MNGKNMLEEVCENDLREVEGGSITVGAALLIIAGGTMVVSAAVSAFNGYQEAKRSEEGKQSTNSTMTL